MSKTKFAYILILIMSIIISGCKNTPSSQIENIPTPTEKQSIEGVYYFEITWEPHGWSFLRFYADGTVINRNTNNGATPEEGYEDVKEFLTMDHRLENWHGTYILNSTDLQIIEYAPGSETSDNILKSDCTYTKEKITFVKVNDEIYNMEYLLLKQS